MKRTIKIILFIFSLLVFILIISTKVEANSIEQIAIDVYLDKTGTATITEVWNANLTQGTEGYKKYGKLGKSNIYDFTVSDDTGRIYETLPYWNVNASFTSKAYKCGIYNDSDDIELCWGISKYGTRSYTLKYKISNFITQYTDAQGIYFNFLNQDGPVDNAKITIHSDTLFSENNAKIWAFGYNGKINFNNGNIVLNSNGRMSSYEYMVALVKFEDNIFNTANTSSLSFQNIYNEAMEEEKVEKLKQNKIYTFWTIWITGGIVIIVFILSVSTIIAVLEEKINAIERKKSLTSVKYGSYGKKLPDMKDIEYYREIPCNGDLFYAYWLCVKYSIVNENTLRKNIVGTILLKWIKNGYITVSKTEKRFI